MSSIFETHPAILVLDTETTGFSPKSEEIIQFSSVMLEIQDGHPMITDEMNILLRLSPGKTVPPEIVKLTGITQECLDTHGIDRREACEQIAARISACDILAAYNAQFDLLFLYYLLSRFGSAECLVGKDKLDLLTVYRDRRPYPHRLLNAIESYNLAGVCNSHRAQDDTLAAAKLLEAMEAEKSDLGNYVNLFGYNPKYGVPKPCIRSVTYRAQPTQPARPLYSVEG